MPKKKVKKAKSKKVSKAVIGKSKETAREKMIGQHIGYRYDVNLLPCLLYTSDAADRRG